MAVARFVYLSLFLVLYPLSAWGQSQDFFSNTQSIDRLSTGSAGACPNCPGFNPDSLIRHSGIDPDGNGPISFSQTLTTTAPSLGGAVTGPFFNQLGPGAVTDNMFGQISSTGANPTKCGQAQGLDGLNCGDIRFDPFSQGMTLPDAPTDNLSSMIAGASAFLGDFSPSTDDHVGFNLKNRFIWSRTTAPLTDADLSVTCTVPTFTCIGIKGQVHQVTPLQTSTNPTTRGLAVTPISAGTVDAPGSGEQIFDLTASWTLNGSSAGSFGFPRVSWSLQFNDPIQDDNNQTRMESGLISGSFVYNSPGIFPTVSFPMVSSSTDLCRGVAGTAGTCTTTP